MKQLLMKSYLGKNFVIHEGVLLIALFVCAFGYWGRIPLFFWLQLTALGVSLVFINLFATKLYTELVINSWSFTYLILALFFASLMSSQALFVIVVIFATSFLMECSPFSLRRFSFFLPVQFCINCTAITVVVLSAGRSSLGVFPFSVFLIFYSAYMSISSLSKLLQQEVLIKKLGYVFAFLGFLLLFLYFAFMYLFLFYAATNFKYL